MKATNDCYSMNGMATKMLMEGLFFFYFHENYENAVPSVPATTRENEISITVI